MTTRDDEGFLSRWSRRKAELRDGVAATPHPNPLPAGEREPEPPLPLAGEGRGEGQASAQPPPPPPPPTLDDVAALTRDADFSRFVAADVEPGVKNAALKKLFSDPHFNTPDPFEPFSGDWTVAEPISEELMKTLNQARTHLFDNENKNAEQEQRPAEQAQAQTAEAPKEDELRRQDT